MPGLVLYDNPTSSNALKVRFLLAELGLPYERRTVPLSRPRPAEYVALNPVGGVPALVDDGFVLAESQAILRYLADREGRDDLYPAAPRERARVDEFLDRFATGFRPAFFRHERLALGYAPGKGGRDAVPRDPEGTPASRARSGRRSRCWTPSWSPPARCSAGSPSPTAPWRRCCTARPRPAWT